MFFQDSGLGISILREIRDPNKMVMEPASIIRIPASMIREPVSSAGIRKSRYAILMAGEALPHRMQQNSAVAKTTGNRVQITGFSAAFCAFCSVMGELIASFSSQHCGLNGTFHLKCNPSVLPD